MECFAELHFSRKEFQVRGSGDSIVVLGDDQHGVAPLLFRAFGIPLPVKERYGVSMLRAESGRP